MWINYTEESVHNSVRMHECGESSYMTAAYTMADNNMQ